MFMSRVAMPLIRQWLFYPQIKNYTGNLGFQYGIVKENLEGHVRILSGIPRFTQNIEGLYKAANYIKNEWEEMDYEVQEQFYPGPEGDPNEYKNVMVSYGPKDAPRIVIGAHYDSESSSQTPGADDNASGIAGILEISRLLKYYNPKLKRRIDIVAYSNEEKPHCGLNHKDYKKYIPYMGSYVHAKSLRDADVSVLGVIILEMIGYYSSKRNSQRYPIKALKLLYPSKGNFIGVISDLHTFDLIQKVKTGLQQNSSINVRVLSVPKSILSDIMRSDHLPYRLLGYDALMLSDTANYRNKRYHTKDDTPDTLDYEKMTEVVKGVYGTILGL